ncbi:MAG: response regulator [Lachnospiraceae bacterium]|nr:response regulator [Lachnospiraceae bacterium]
MMQKGQLGENKGSFWRRDRFIRVGVTALFFLATTLVQTHFDIENWTSNGLFSMFDYMLLPAILLSGLCGSVPAMISYVVLFLVGYFRDGEFAYAITIVLIVEIWGYYFVLRGHARSLRRTLLTFVSMTIVAGPMWGLMMLVLNARGYADFSWSYNFNYTLRVAPEIFLALGIIYLVLNVIPEQYRQYFYMGGLYRKDEAGQKRMVRSVISKRVLAIILAEGIMLGVAAAVFANQLIPDIRDNVSTQQGSGILSDFMEDNRGGPGNTESQETHGESNTSTTVGEETTATSAESEATEGLTEEQAQQVRFLLNNKGIAFDAKLILLIISVAVPFMVLANYYAQHYIAGPVTSLSKKLGEFTAADLEQKESMLEELQAIEIHSKDEIGELYKSVYEMAVSITSYVDQVKREQKLQEDLRVAQKSAETKAAFLSNVSHELRTPINAVLGMDEMILRESSEPEIIGYAVDIQNASRSLLGLVNDILDSSKLESGKMEIIPVQYDLASSINDLINMVSAKAADKHLKLDVMVNEQMPHLLYGDEIRIKQVILNILTNAVKYTEEGSVTMTFDYEKTSEDGMDLLVHVKDTGIGIKEEDIRKLFSRFERIEEERNRNIEGTGLGMSIVKQLLDLMDTHLDVESVYGEGSDFSFRLHQQVVKWDAIGNFTEMYERTKRQNTGYKESFRAPMARLLVVDDTPMNLTVVKGLLKRTQVQIDTAESGFETLDLVKKIKYDMIFLDHRMPEMDGVETLAKMQEMPENLNRETPVIALTANALSGARETYLEAGFTDFMSKPIDGLKLEHLVEQYLPEELIERGEAEEEAASEPETSVHISPLAGITSIDYESAIQNCGSEELLMQVLTEYVTMVPTKSADIEKFWQARDYDNYTVLVHALKSSSRLIGALRLSELAAELEAAGDRVRGGDESGAIEIDEKTPEMLGMYRSYFDKLSPLISNEQEGADVRPEIPLEELQDAIGAIREFAEAFDFDSADDVMHMLNDYKIPEAYEEAVKKIGQRLAEVDQAALLEAIAEANL